MGRVVGPWWSAAFKALGFIPGTVKEKKIQSRSQKLMLKVTGRKSLGADHLPLEWALCCPLPVFEHRFCNHTICVQSLSSLASDGAVLSLCGVCLKPVTDTK